MVLGHKAAFHTLGCKLNFSETSTLARQLASAGYARVPIDDAPDVVVINTCSVTDHADAKCRNAVRRAMQSNPDAFVVVVGCYAQLKPAEIANIEGVDLVLGAGEKFNLADHLVSASKGDEAKVAHDDGVDDSETRREDRRERLPVHPRWQTTHVLPPTHGVQRPVWQQRRCFCCWQHHWQRQT